MDSVNMTSIYIVDPLSEGNTNSILGQYSYLSVVSSDRRCRRFLICILFMIKWGLFERDAAL